LRRRIDSATGRSEAQCKLDSWSRFRFVVLIFALFNNLDPDSYAGRASDVA
jgi:hypothetical protein